MKNSTAKSLKRIELFDNQEKKTEKYRCYPATRRNKWDQKLSILVVCF